MQVVGKTISACCYCLLSPYLPYHFFSYTELKFATRFQPAMWEVTRVVKPGELGGPDERLREQMRKLELPSQIGVKMFW